MLSSYGRSDRPGEELQTGQENRGDGASRPGAAAQPPSRPERGAGCLSSGTHLENKSQTRGRTRAPAESSLCPEPDPRALSPVRGRLDSDGRADLLAQPSTHSGPKPCSLDDSTPASHRPFVASEGRKVKPQLTIKQQPGPGPAEDARRRRALQTVPTNAAEPAAQAPVAGGAGGARGCPSSPAQSPPARGPSPQPSSCGRPSRWPPPGAVTPMTRSCPHAGHRTRTAGGSLVCRTWSLSDLVKWQSVHELRRSGPR